jgi:hypothetical protein
VVADRMQQVNHLRGGSQEQSSKCVNEGELVVFLRTPTAIQLTENAGGDGLPAFGALCAFVARLCGDSASLPKPLFSKEIIRGPSATFKGLTRTPDEWTKTLGLSG